VIIIFKRKTVNSEYKCMDFHD